MKYNLKKDHEEIKKQIKEWEIEMDLSVDSLLNILEKYGDIEINKNGEDKSIYLLDLINALEGLSHEMMAINI
jgi:hypothetical protein